MPNGPLGLITPPSGPLRRSTSLHISSSGVPPAPQVGRFNSWGRQNKGLVHEASNIEQYNELLIGNAGFVALSIFGFEKALGKAGITYYDYVFVSFLWFP